MNIENFKNNLNWAKEEQNEEIFYKEGFDKYKEKYLDENLVDIEKDIGSYENDFKKKLATKLNLNPDKILIGENWSKFKSNDIELFLGDLRMKIGDFLYREDKEYAHLPKILDGELVIGDDLLSDEGIIERLNEQPGLLRIKFPEYISGRMWSKQGAAPEGTIFPKYVGDDVMIDLEQGFVGKNIKFPEVVDGNFSLGVGLRNLNRVELPKIINGNLSMRQINSATNVKFPEFVNGTINLGRLETIDGLDLSKTNFKMLYVSENNIEKEAADKLVKMYPGKVSIGTH